MVYTADLKHLGRIGAAAPDENDPVRFHKNPDGMDVATIQIPFDMKGSQLILSYKCEGAKNNQVFYDLLCLKEILSRDAGKRTRDTHPEKHYQDMINEEQDKDIQTILETLKGHEKSLGLLPQDKVMEDGSRKAAFSMHINRRFKRDNTTTVKHLDAGKPVNNEFGISVKVKNHDDIIVSGQSVVQIPYENFIINEQGERATYSVLHEMTEIELLRAKHMEEQKWNASYALTQADQKVYEQRLKTEASQQEKNQKEPHVLKEFKISAAEFTQAFNMTPVISALAEHNLKILAKNGLNS